MLNAKFAKRFIILNLLVLLTSCYHPPYNNFKPYNRSYKDLAAGAAVGTAVGAFAGSTLIGTGVGATVVTAYGLAQVSRKNTIRELRRRDIQFEQYGDTMTLIVPTDRYFLFNSPRINPICYPGLELIVRLLNFYPKCMIHIAGFTDNIGSYYHKKMLTQGRAEAMLTFLWAHKIPSKYLQAEGYGDKYAVSDNKIIHGSAQNRRLEIQWYCGIANETRIAPWATK